MFSTPLLSHYQSLGVDITTGDDQRLVLASSESVLTSRLRLEISSIQDELFLELLSLNNKNMSVNHESLPGEDLEHSHVNERNERHESKTAPIAGLDADEKNERDERETKTDLWPLFNATPEFRDWQHRPFASCASKPPVAEADVLAYLPTGTYSRQDYEKAYEAAKKAKGD
jgi:hypothetical protein